MEQQAGPAGEAAAVAISPHLSDAVVRLDESFRRLRRWMTNPPSSPELDALLSNLDDRLETVEVDPAKVAACEAVVSLREGGPVAVGAVAEYLLLERSTASRLLSDCEKQDLVRRHHDEADRRRVLVDLTPRGERVAEQTAGVRRRMIAEMVGDWDERELEIFLDRFGQLAERIGHVVGEVVAGRVPAELARAFEAMAQEQEQERAQVIDADR